MKLNRNSDIQRFFLPHPAAPQHPLHSLCYGEGFPWEEKIMRLNKLFYNLVLLFMRAYSKPEEILFSFFGKSSVIAWQFLNDSLQLYKTHTGFTPCQTIICKNFSVNQILILSIHSQRRFL